MGPRVRALSEVTRKQGANGNLGKGVGGKNGTMCSCRGLNKLTAGGENGRVQKK